MFPKALFINVGNTLRITTTGVKGNGLWCIHLLEYYTSSKNGPTSDALETCLYLPLPQHSPHGLLQGTFTNPPLHRSLAEVQWGWGAFSHEKSDYLLNSDNNSCL